MSKYKIELHSHSAESSRCGLIEAAEVVKKYKEAGYSALVLTDHYYAHFFDKISNLKMISGSDFHEYEDLARGGIAAADTLSEIGELISLLKDGDYELIRNGKH